jgi:hypothetical protein
MKKGRGRLIHVSDFVEEDNGRLIICNQEGAMVKDTRCITYPGSAGDPWWDHAQLLAQVNRAIGIFKEAHPNCVVLFVFDHSSAHVSLGPDALRAFDMNKSNGGKMSPPRPGTNWADWSDAMGREMYLRRALERLNFEYPPDDAA